MCTINILVVVWPWIFIVSELIRFSFFSHVTVIAAHYLVHRNRFKSYHTVHDD